MSRVASLFAVCALCVFAAPGISPGAVFTNDFLAAEATNDEDGSFGPWQVGGTNKTDPTDVTATYTAYTNALHLDNWGSLLPESAPNAPTESTDNDGPFANGEFKGYGYDTALAVPAIVINTTSSTLSPCCGISGYAPAEVFIHSTTSIEQDPNRRTQVVQYTATETGLLNIQATFTQKHTGVIPFAIFQNNTAVPLGSGTTTGQDTSMSYANPAFAVMANDVIQFRIGGQASSSFNATINAVPEPTSVVLGGLGLAFGALRRRRQA